MAAPSHTSYSDIVAAWLHPTAAGPRRHRTGFSIESVTPDLLQTYKHNYIMPGVRLSMKGLAVHSGRRDFNGHDASGLAFLPLENLASPLRADGGPIIDPAQETGKGTGQDQGLPAGFAARLLPRQKLDVPGRQGGRYIGDAVTASRRRYRPRPPRTGIRR
jgi:hypothetical protein